MNSQPPMVYDEAVELAEKVVRNFNGRQEKLFLKTSVYSASRLAARYKEERDTALADLKAAKQEKGNLQRRVNQLDTRRSPLRRGGGYGASGSGRPSGRGSRDEQRDNQGDRDKEFKVDRASVCREWNTQEGCTFTNCRKEHACNSWLSKGKCCKGSHKGFNHR